MVFTNVVKNIKKIRMIFYPSRMPSSFNTLNTMSIIFLLRVGNLLISSRLSTPLTQTQSIAEMVGGDPILWNVVDECPSINI